MAKDEDDDDAAASAAPDKKGSSKKLVFIVVGALALVGVSVGGTLLGTGLFGKHEEPAKKVVKKKAADAETADAADNADAADAEGGEGGDAKTDEGDAEGAPAQTVYLDFEQPFVVNFQDEGQLRYLQITVSVMASQQAAIDAVKRHMPLIRNNLVMLFSGMSRDAALSREGKEKIRKDAEAEVQKVLKEQTGKPGIKALYFTSFVMQ